MKERSARTVEISRSRGSGKWIGNGFLWFIGKYKNATGEAICLVGSDQEEKRLCRAFHYEALRLRDSMLFMPDSDRPVVQGACLVVESNGLDECL